MGGLELLFLMLLIMELVLIILWIGLHVQKLWWWYEDRWWAKYLEKRDHEH